jgi:Methyltransferase domain.
MVTVFLMLDVERVMYLRLSVNKRIINGFGIDVSPKMITIAQDKNPDFEFVTGDSGNLPYTDESMDVVMACMALSSFS